MFVRCLPGSEASRLCWDAGAWDRGPGVPGDLTSSFTGPPYDNDDEGGLCNQKQYLSINDDALSFLGQSATNYNQMIISKCQTVTNTMIICITRFVLNRSKYHKKKRKKMKQEEGPVDKVQQYSTREIQTSDNKNNRKKIK